MDYPIPGRFGTVRLPRTRGLIGVAARMDLADAQMSENDWAGTRYPWPYPEAHEEFVRASRSFNALRGRDQDAVIMVHDDRDGIRRVL
jgi:hypothetical protein